MIGIARSDDHRDQVACLNFNTSERTDFDIVGAMGYPSSQTLACCTPAHFQSPCHTITTFGMGMAY